MTSVDFSGFQFEGAENVPISNYVKFHLTINGFYNGADCKYISQDTYDLFKKALPEKLEAAGFTIVNDVARDNCKATIPGTDTEIYLHPLMTSGIATPAEIDNLKKVLEDIPCVKSSYEASDRITLYDISRDDYRNLIYDNAAEIAKCIIQGRGKIVYKFDCEQEWCNLHRIKTTYANTGFCTADVDAAAIKNIRDECEKLIDQGCSKKNIPKIVAETAQKWKQQIASVQEHLDNETKNMSLEDKAVIYDLNHYLLTEENLKRHINNMNLSDYLRIGNRDGLFRNTEDQIKYKNENLKDMD